jgi:DNA-binding transcriptional MerR regulator
MTTPETAPAKPTQATWADWMPPGDNTEHAPTWTREELIARLATLGVTVTVTDFRFWEGSGVLPRAVKRWHEETRSVRALYPGRAVWIVSDLRDLQNAGCSLKQIGRILRGRAQTYHLPDPYNLRPAIVEAVRQREQQTGEPVSVVMVRFTDAFGHEEPYFFDFEDAAQGRPLPTFLPPDEGG